MIVDVSKKILIVGLGLLGGSYAMGSFLAEKLGRKLIKGKNRRNAPVLF